MLNGPICKVVDFPKFVYQILHYSTCRQSHVNDLAVLIADYLKD